MDKVFPQPGPGKGCDHSIATYAPHTATPGMTGEECDKKNLDIQMVKKKGDMAVHYLHLSLLRD